MTHSVTLIQDQIIIVGRGDASRSAAAFKGRPIGIALELENGSTNFNEICFTIM